MNLAKQLAYSWFNVRLLLDLWVGNNYDTEESQLAAEKPRASCNYLPRKLILMKKLATAGTYRRWGGGGRWIRGFYCRLKTLRMYPDKSY